jgi:integrase
MPDLWPWFLSKSERERRAGEIIAESDADTVEHFEKVVKQPVSPTNIIRRHLHQALKELKYVNPFTGMHKAGNHAFRRFRNTYLRNYTECPAGLYKYWMGHAGEDMKAKARCSIKVERSLGTRSTLSLR